METLTIDLKKKKSFEIGQQGDHNALCIHFINMKNVGTNKKYIYYTIDGIENCVPLTNDRFIVGYPLTAHSGIASAQLISKLNDNTIIKLSNVFAMHIKESKGYKDSGEYPVDPNIQSSYDLLDDLIDKTQDLINNYNYATLMEKLTQASSEATTSATTAKKCADELKSSTDFINTLDDKVAAQDSKIEKIEASTSHITTKQNTKIAALQTRMSEFTSLKEGSTTGDAELIDARIGADGTKYASAGDAMRGQVEQLNEDLVDVDKAMVLNNYLVNPDEFETGALNNGVVNAQSSQYYTSGYIDLSDYVGKTVYFITKTGNNAIRSIAFFTKEKIFDSNLQYWIKSFTVKANAPIIRFDFTKEMFNNFGMMISDRLDVKYSDYSPNKYKNVGNMIDDIYNEIEVEADLVLPKNIRTIQGQRLFIYFANILKYATRNQFYAVSLNDIDNEQLEDAFLLDDSSLDIDRLSTFYFKPTNQTIYGYPHKQSHIINKPLKNTDKAKKCLFIGDSLTDAGVYTQKLLDMFTGTDKIELLGTRGSGLNKHEGRAGWRAWTYTHYASTDGTEGEGISATNPFWNPSTNKFDFTFYMNNQDYSSVDYVFIDLGTNDLARSTHNTETDMIDSWNEIIDSIKAYDSNIKVCTWLPPLRSQVQNPNRSNIDNAMNTLEILIKNYDNKENENIYLVPVYLNVNPKTDYGKKVETVNGVEITLTTDAVHPIALGYQHIAEVIYGYIKQFMYM